MVKFKRGKWKCEFSQLDMFKENYNGEVLDVKKKKNESSWKQEAFFTYRKLHSPKECTCAPDARWF